MRNASAKKRQHPISSHLELCSVQTGGMTPLTVFMELWMEPGAGEPD